MDSLLDMKANSYLYKFKGVAFPSSHLNLTLKMLSSSSDVTSKGDFLTIEGMECSSMWQLMDDQLREIFIIRNDVEGVTRRIIGENFLV